jgi:hypothetical protein
MIETLERRLTQWDEYEKLKDELTLWLQETDSKLHGIDLKPSLEAKMKHLDAIKVSINEPCITSLTGQLPSLSF